MHILNQNHFYCIFSAFIFIFYCLGKKRMHNTLVENLTMILPDHVMQQCHLEAHLSNMLLFIAHITLLVQTKITYLSGPLKSYQCFISHYVIQMATYDLLYYIKIKLQTQTPASWGHEHFHYRPRGGAENGNQCCQVG